MTTRLMGVAVVLVCVLVFVPSAQADDRDVLRVFERWERLINHASDRATESYRNARRTRSGQPRRRAFVRARSRIRFARVRMQRARRQLLATEPSNWAGFQVRRYGARGYRHHEQGFRHAQRSVTHLIHGRYERSLSEMRRYERRMARAQRDLSRARAESFRIIAEQG